MKALFAKIYPFILIVIIVVIEVLIRDNPLISLIFSIAAVAFLGWFLLRYSYHRKSIRIKWLRNKLESTEELLIKKHRVEANIIEKMPIGIIIYDDNYEVTWSNDTAKAIFENALERRRLEVLSQSIYQALIEHTDAFKMITKIYREEYEINADVRSQTLYLTNVTNQEACKRKMNDSIPAILKLNLDNLEDAISELDVSKQTMVQGKYLEALEAWAEEYEFYLAPITNSKLVAVMKKSVLSALIKNEFKIIDYINDISSEYSVLVTLSAGVACGDLGYDRLGDIAEDALNLALSRGGDQIVVNLENHELMYFGGNTNTAEKRTKITTRTNMLKLEQLFEETNRVYIMPHRSPDTDAFGAAIGALKLAMAYGKEAVIILDRQNVDKTVQKIMQLIEYEYITILDYIVSPITAIDSITRDDLLVLVDHHSFNQTLDKRFISRTKHLAIIDHHRKLNDAINGAKLSHIEPYASSTVELVTEMIELCENEIDINKFEATVMLSGIMVDTNNFMYRTGSRTFEASALLRKYGADTFKVKTILREGLEDIQLKSQLLGLAEVVHNRFSIVIIPDELKPERTLLAKVADDLLEIEDIVAAFAIGRIADGFVAISARSLEGFNVQVVMEKFKGGGHLNNAGAQIETDDIKQVRLDLIHELNKAVKEEEPMKVILIKDLRGKGKKGEVIDVANGYGNYLMTNKIAIEATQENLQTLEMEQQKLVEKEKKVVKKMKVLKDKIEQLPVKVFVKIGQKGKLYGKINTKKIADEYKKQHGITLDKRKIQLNSPIESLGNYKVDVKLHKDVNAVIEVLVVEE
jgi:ribosomal protein L9